MGRSSLFPFVGFLVALTLALGITALWLGLASSVGHANQLPPCPSPITQDTTLTGDCEGSIVVTANKVQLDLGGHTVQSPAGPPAATGITLAGVSRVHVSNGTVTGFKLGILLDNADGNHLNGLTVTGNVFNGGPGVGVRLQNSDDNRINGSAFSNNHSTGLLLGNSHGNRLHSLEITDNIHPTGFVCGSGLRLENSNNNFLTSSDVSRNCGVGVFLITSTGNKIVGNIVNDIINPATASGRGAGISLFSDSDGNIIRSNTANGNSGGIQVFDDSNVISSNITNGNSAVGIDLAGGINNTIRSNTSLGNGVDLFDSKPNCDANIWKSNTFGTSNQGCIQ